MDSLITVAGLLHDASCVRGIVPDVHSSNTLNSQVDVNNVTLDNTSLHSLQYLGVGVGGYTDDDSDNTLIDVIVPVNHSITKLRENIPLVLRAEDDDLTEEEQEIYTLKKTLSFRPFDETESATYYAYYLKDISTEIKESPIDTQVCTSDISCAIFTPGQTVLSNAQLNGSIIISAPITFSLSIFDVNEIINVLQLLYGTDHDLVVNEFGLYTGVSNVDVPTGVQLHTYIAKREILVNDIPKLGKEITYTTRLPLI